jgi:hypothetical protein
MTWSSWGPGSNWKTLWGPAGPLTPQVLGSVSHCWRRPCAWSAQLRRSWVQGFVSSHFTLSFYKVAQACPRPHPTYCAMLRYNRDLFWSEGKRNWPYFWELRAALLNIKPHNNFLSFELLKGCKSSWSIWNKWFKWVSYSAINPAWNLCLCSHHYFLLFSCNSRPGQISHLLESLTTWFIHWETLGPRCLGQSE